MIRACLKCVEWFEMKEEYRNFNMDIIELWSVYRPKWSVQTYILIAVIAGLMFLFLWKLFTAKQWKKSRMFAAFLIVWYMVFVYGSTVFTRTPGTQMRYCLEVFWSYRWGIRVYGDEMIKEILLNCMMLMPLGVLLPAVFPAAGRYESITVFIGFLVSFSIEVLQLVLKCGLFEFDDIIHNTAGVAVGYFIYKLAVSMGSLEARVSDIQRGV